MNKVIELQIIRPTSKEVLNVDWIDIQTPTGNFVVGPDHSPLVSILKERGHFSYRKVGSQNIKVVDSYGGFLKVQDNKALIILDV